MPCLPRLVLGLRFAEFLLLEALQHAPAGRVSGEGARVVMDRESLTRIEDKSALRDMTTPCSARPRSLDWARAFGTEPDSKRWTRIREKKNRLSKGRLELGLNRVRRGVAARVSSVPMDKNKPSEEELEAAYYKCVNEKNGSWEGFRFFVIACAFGVPATMGMPMTAPLSYRMFPFMLSGLGGIYADYKFINDTCKKVRLGKLRHIVLWGVYLCTARTTLPPACPWRLLTAQPHPQSTGYKANETRNVQVIYAKDEWEDIKDFFSGKDGRRD